MEWRYVVTDDELPEHLGSMSCGCGRWDRGFSSWIVGKGGVRGRLTPRWSIVSEDGTPLAGHARLA